VFGQPALLDERRRPVPFRAKKHLALLIYLALGERERGVSRDELIELFWPDVPAARGRHSLAQALLAVRERLGSDAVPRGDQTVRLGAALDTELDLLRRGETPSPQPDFAHPLLGLDACAGSSFAHWVDAARASIANTVRALLSHAIVEARAAGLRARVHECAQQLYAVDPLNDAAVVALAERHLLENDRKGAMALLNAYVARLHDELALKPESRVVQLLERISTASEARPSAPATRVSRAADTAAVAFVGREAELRELECEWERAQAGGVRSVLVAGPPGIGKTAVLQEFGRSVAARTHPVWHATCQHIGEHIPFAAVGDVVQELLRSSAVSAADPNWLSELSRITPQVRHRYPGVPEPSPAPPDSIRVRLAEALARVLETAADGVASLLILDDLQYVDAASREIVLLALRRVTAAPIMFLGALRRDEPNARGGIELSSVLGHRWNLEVEVPQLGFDDALTLAGRLVATSTQLPRSVAERIVAAAEGNPYLIELLVSDWLRNGERSLAIAPPDLNRDLGPWQVNPLMRTAFGRQHDGLTSDAEHLVQVLAVAGREMTLAQCASLTKLRREAVEHAVVELLDRRVLRFVGGNVSFRNELHRSYVYYAITDDSRRYTHARMAGWLAESGAHWDFQNALEVALHYLRADMVTDAATHALRGADEALRRGAAREVRVVADAAARRLPAADLRTQRLTLLAARAAELEGDYRGVLARVVAWRDPAATKDDLAMAAWLKAEALHRGPLADDHTILAAAESAVRSAASAADVGVLIDALQVRAQVAAEQGDVATVDAIRRQTARMDPRMMTPEARPKAEVLQGYCSLIACEVTSAERHFAMALRQLESAPDDPLWRRALLGVGLTQIAIGDHERGIRTWRRAIDAAERLGDAAALAVTWSNMGVAFLDRGRFRSAEQAYSNARQAIERVPTPRRLAELQVNLVGLSIVRGEFRRARDHLDQARDHAKDAGVWWMLRDVSVFEADYYQARGASDSTWHSVEAAQDVSAGRRYGLGAAGMYERLLRQHAFASGGMPRLTDLAQSRPAEAFCFQLRDHLSVRAVTNELMAQATPVARERAAQAWEMLRQSRFKGTLAYLQAIGIR
jgi:DNA-binding SARP family transcriptional activator/tetratricopeptide (TPR) repeat protein